MNSESLSYVKQTLKKKVSLLIRHKADLPLWIRRMSWQSSGDVYRLPEQASLALLSVTGSSLTCDRFQDKGTETPTDSCHPEDCIRQSAAAVVTVITVPQPHHWWHPTHFRASYILSFTNFSLNFFYKIFHLKKNYKTHISIFISISPCSKTHNIRRILS